MSHDKNAHAESRVYKRKESLGTRRGTGPSDFAQIVEITSGRAIFQQGLTATCKDRPNRGNPNRKEEFGLAHESVRAMKEG
jgi:hypothetical protein